VTPIFWMRCGFSLLFGAAGLYLITAAVRAIRGFRDFNARAVETEGKIIGFETRSPSGDAAYKKLFAPIVTFHAPGGELIRFVSSLAQRPNPYEVGQQVAVRYLPEDLASADLAASAGAWWPIAAMIFMAIVMLTVSTLPWVLS
jgi:hypothetical protein